MKKRSSFVRNHVLRTFMIIFCLIISVKSEAGIVFDGSPGTNAPPGSLGGFPMIPFSPDTRPLDGLVNFVPVGGACPAEFDLTSFSSRTHRSGLVDMVAWIYRGCLLYIHSC